MTTHQQDVSDQAMSDGDGPATARHALDDAFRKGLSLDGDFDVATAAYGVTEEWDSLAHMQLVTCIEVAFDIMIDTDDVIAMSDYPTVRRILTDSYGITT